MRNARGLYKGENTKNTKKKIRRPQSEKYEGIRVLKLTL